MDYRRKSTGAFFRRSSSRTLRDPPLGNESPQQALECRTQMRLRLELTRCGLAIAGQGAKAVPHQLGSPSVLFCRRIEPLRDTKTPQQAKRVAEIEPEAVQRNGGAIGAAENKLGGC